MRRRSCLLILPLLLLVSCRPPVPPVSPPPAPPSGPASTVFDIVPEQDGWAVQGADVNVDGIHQTCCVAGVTTWTKPADQPTTDVTITATGFETVQTTIPVGPGTHRIALTTIARGREHGALRVSGPHFLDEDGNPWRWQGATMFTLLERQMAGEDITPQIAWMIQHRVNVARVFVAGVEWPGHQLLAGRPDWPQQLRTLADRLAEAGLRMEATICTVRCNDQRFWHPVLQQAYDSLAGTWNTTVEWINEPWVQGDGLTWVRVNRHGILSAYGIQPLDTAYDIKHLDYITVHLPRDRDHFPRNSKDLWEIQNTNGVPAVGDEPLGVADYDKDGSGARTTDLLSVVSHFAICAELAAGCTLHSQFGLEGRAPHEGEPISEAIATAVARVWGFVPPRAVLGDYSAPHTGTFPLAWSVFDSEVAHAYAALSRRGEGWVVNPMPAPGFRAIGVDGWTVVEQLDDLPVWRVVREQ